MVLLGATGWESEEAKRTFEGVLAENSKGPQATLMIGKTGSR